MQWGVSLGEISVVSVSPWFVFTTEARRARRLEQAGLERGGGLHICGEAADFGPGDDEAVVGEALLGPAFFIAQAIQPIGEVAGNFTSASQFSQQCGGSGFALLIEGMDEVLGDFPVGDAVVLGGIPV